MIKTLRRKFIAITMCSVVVVLGVIMGIINAANFYDINSHANELLAVLAENNGSFPKPDNMPHGKKPPRDISIEAPFETRYFTVMLRADRSVASVNTGRIAAITTEAAAEIAVELNASGKTGGFWDKYKYRTLSLDDGLMYIFLDCGRELTTFFSFLTTSCLVAILGTLSVLVLVVFFSKRAIKPMAESYEKQKQFITDAGHELKTPLTIIDASTEVLEMESGENEWTKSIKNQIERLGSLIEKLVFLSRMDEEQSRLQMTDFSLSDAVLEAAQPFEAVAAAQEKTLQLEIESGISYYGDEALLRRLLSLLLDNAMKYSTANSQILLSLKTVGKNGKYGKYGKNKEITVFNKTSKIEQGGQDYLFERFRRADSSRNSETGGHGIGLSVAKAIVAAHKGTISARSDDGSSIIFTVTL